MPLTQLHEQEILLVNWLLERVRNSFNDLFFSSFSQIDSFTFTGILIVFAWHFINQKVGWRLFFILSLSWSLNIFLKQLFESPRPCQAAGEMGLLCPHTYGFPSGTAQFTTLIALLSITEIKNLSIRIVFICFAVLSCFSRLYFGFHYISDILGGVACAIALWIFYCRCVPLFEKRVSFRILIFILLISPLLGIDAWKIISIFLGIEAGLSLTKYSRGKASGKIVSFFLSCVTVFILAWIEQKAPASGMIVFPAMGFCVSYLSKRIASIFFDKIL